MPTYDFRCPSGHDSEHFFRKFSDAPTEVRCPECGAEAVRRVSGGAGLVFKGSGFYLTDYGKNAHRKPAADGSKADGKADSGGAKAESSKSDSAGGSGSDRRSDRGSDRGSDSGSDSGSSSPKAESAKPTETKAPTTKSKSSDGQ